MKLISSPPCGPCFGLEDFAGLRVHGDALRVAHAVGPDFGQVSRFLREGLLAGRSKGLPGQAGRRGDAQDLPR